MKPVVGIFNSEAKANAVIEALKSSGLDSDTIQLISKYAMLSNDDEAFSYFDPNANIFNLDHNGLDVPLNAAENAELNKSRSEFTNKIQSIFSDAIDNSELQQAIERAEDAGYIVIVQTNSTEEFSKASAILLA